MKKRIATLIFTLLMLLTSCTAPIVQSGEEQSSPSQPAADAQEEPNATGEQNTASGDYRDIYESAIQLLTADPADTHAYLIALDALSNIAAQSYEEQNRLLAAGVQSAADPSLLVQWAKQNQPAPTLVIPYVPDSLSPDEINTVGITTGNMTNCAKYGKHYGWWVGGLLTWQGDWVYLTRPDEDFAIYKMRFDGSEYQRVGEANGSCLNVIGDNLYFIDHFNSDKLCTMRLDGEGKASIGDDTDCAFLSVSGDWMYYHNGSDGGCLYRIKTDGSAREKLVDATVIFACVAEDGYVYYMEKAENSGVYRIPAGGGSPETVIAPGEQSYSLLDENGENEVFISAGSNSVQVYCVLDDWIYFYDSSEPFNIRRVHADGTSHEVIWPFSTPLTAMNIADGVLSCSFGDGYSEDGFVTGTDVLTMDMSNVAALHRVRDNDKLQHVVADTEPVCTGPHGYIYYFKYSEGMAWYGLSPDGTEFRIG